MLCFDFETGPLPEAIIRDRVPLYEPAPLPGEFDSAAVKIGNLVDPGKIRAKIEAARQKHADTVAGYEASLVTGEAEYWAKIMDRAALSPITGEIVAIGYLSTDDDKQFLDYGRLEAEMLDAFWAACQTCINNHHSIVGHNIEGFDLPFAVQRSWILSVDVPDYMHLSVYDRRKYFTDTMVRWSMGARGKDGFVKLDTLARIFGIGGKPDDIDGSMFAGLLLTDPEKALAYLANDLQMTRGVAERLNIL